MYHPEFITKKQKGCRWHCHNKVTAFSVETAWHVHALAGKERVAKCAASATVGISAAVDFNTRTTVDLQTDTTFSLRQRAKLKNKAKRWAVYSFLVRRRGTKWKGRLAVGLAADATWAVNGLLQKYRKVRFGVLSLQTLKRNILFRVFSNPTVRSAGWTVHRSVGVKRKVSHTTHAVVSRSVQAEWDTHHLGKTVKTTWKAVGRLVVEQRIQTIDRLHVCRVLSTGWAVRTKVYSLKPLRYSVIEGIRRLVIPARPLPIQAKSPPVAVVPNITWNRLTTKQKQKLSK